jgi:hypothetical protein
MHAVMDVPSYEERCAARLAVQGLPGMQGLFDAEVCDDGDDEEPLEIP